MKNWLPIMFLFLSQSAVALEDSELSALLEQVREDRNMPGLRAAVRTADGRIISAATGLADKENNIELNNTVGMPGGSTGMVFVATLTMLLVEDGLLSTDDLASKWLGHTAWFSRLPNSEEIRVKHLLSHSSGVKDYPDSVRCKFTSVWRILRRGSNEFTPEELIECVLDRDPIFPVGEGFYHSDAAYLVLGRLVEAVSGQEYYDLVQQRILDPLELNQIRPQNTQWLPDITPGYASGARNLRKDGTSKYNPTSEWTGGGLVTNPTMLVEFYGALVDGEIVNDESFELMLRGEWSNPEDSRFHYGYGLSVDEDSNSFGYGGMWPGYRTHVTHFSELGITVAVQTNRDGRVNLPSVIASIVELSTK